MDEAMLALMRLGLEDAVDSVAMAAVHLVSERRRAQEKEAREQFQESPVIEELTDDDKAEACACGAAGGARCYPE